MGLRLSHDAGAWSYSGFGDFRCALWTACGFKGILYDLYATDEQMVAVDHPLFPLFNHADSEGELTPEELGPMIPVLETLIPKLGYFSLEAQRFLDGAKQAIELGEAITFG